LINTLHYLFIHELALLPYKQIIKVMKNQKQSIDTLMDAMFEYMRSLHRCEGTINRYHRKWRKLKDFMLANQIRYYDSEVEKAYLSQLLGDFDYHQLNCKEKELVNAIEYLTEFQKTGRIFMGQRKHKPKEFKGSTGRIITNFINHRKALLNLSKTTIQSYTHNLYPFYCHLNKKEVIIRDVKSSDILGYIEQMDPQVSAKKHVSLNILRIFFRYLYDHDILQVDYSHFIPRINYKKQSKLPSTYTDGEIEALLKAVDRGNPRGKRDYAILLLITRLGLRAADICELKFENILWEHNVLVFNQHKTGKSLELPLLPEIGNAIIDYLKYARPASSISNCFIHVCPPYEQIHTSDLGNMVRRYITLAGINHSDRKHGPHAFRHCFASALLKNKAPLPVISEALGHSNTKSTMLYLRIDSNSLKKCALEVPPVPSSFYTQKGGYCHD
jgi:site-specific recombinase XerD